MFINWFLSQRGQTALQNVMARVEDNVPDLLRIDVPKDNIPLENRRVPGVQYLELDSRPEWIEMGDIIKLFNEALAKRDR